MIQVTPHMRILVATQPLDFRKRIDGTAATCRQVLGCDPMAGALFVFRNKAATMIRVLVYDGQGFWLMTKRLSKGKFEFWCDGNDRHTQQIVAHQLQALIVGGDWPATEAAEAWRALVV